MNILPFQGKTMVRAEIADDKSVVTLYFEDGTAFQMYHDQNCCESVHLYDIDGDINDLIGSPMVVAEEVVGEQDAGPQPEYPDSWTWTFYKFRTNQASITMRWLGESNGFYSEHVDTREIAWNRRAESEGE